MENFMSTISHNELKKRAVLTTSNDPASGKVFDNNGVYKVWDGRTYVRIGDTGICKLYDNVADFPSIGEKGLLYRLRLENHFYAWDGSIYRKVGDVEDAIRQFDVTIEMDTTANKPSRAECITAFKLLPNFDWSKSDKFYILSINKDKYNIVKYLPNGDIDETGTNYLFWIKELTVAT